MSMSSAAASDRARRRSARGPARACRQVAVHVAHAGLVGDRPVAGHQHVAPSSRIRSHATNQLPRLGPHDRRAVDEQQIAGEHGGARGTWTIVSPRYAPGRARSATPRGRRRAGQPALERLRRRAHRDPLEVERAERVLDERRGARRASRARTSARGAAAGSACISRRWRATRRSRRRSAAARCRSSGRGWRACSCAASIGCALDERRHRRRASRASDAGRTACRPAARCRRR